jgi:hypothetical protein
MIATRRTFAWNAFTRCTACALVAIGAAGCAELPATSNARQAPYEGVFTGEFVDGRPLYRFPPIEVIGRRSSAASTSGAQDGS